MASCTACVIGMAGCPLRAVPFMFPASAVLGCALWWAVDVGSVGWRLASFTACGIGLAGFPLRVVPFRFLPQGAMRGGVA